MWVIIRLPAHILAERKEHILLINTNCIKSSYIRKLVPSYKASIEFATSFYPIVNLSLRQLELISLSTGDVKRTAPGDHPRSGKEHSFCTWNLSPSYLSILRVHIYSWAIKMPEKVDTWSNQPASLISCLLGCKAKSQLVVSIIPQDWIICFQLIWNCSLPRILMFYKSGDRIKFAVVVEGDE